MKLSKFLLIMLAGAQFSTACAVISSTQATQSSNPQATKSSDPKPAPMVAQAKEPAAKSRMRMLQAAEAACMAETTQYAPLDELERRGYASDPSEGKLANYKFKIRVPSDGFKITAVPLKYGVSGIRSFFSDQPNPILPPH